MNNNFDYIIFGNNVAAIVLAERLSSLKKNIMLVNPAKSWGGIFGGININNEIFDIGMTNFEFDLFGSYESSINNYSADPNRKLGEYVHFVENYISIFTEYHEINTPTMLFNSTFVDDLIITNNFDALKLIPQEQKKNIVSELKEILAAENLLHPSTKIISKSKLNNVSLETASIANHGKTFHNIFIEPFFNKLLNKKTSEIPAIFHRNGWVPLFYPETLLSQFTDNPQIIKKTIFKYPNKKYFGSFIKAIVEKIQNRGNIRILYDINDSDINNSSKTFSIKNESYNFGKFIWTGELNSFMRNYSNNSGWLSKEESKADLDLLFLSVNEGSIKNKFSILLNLDNDFPFYRVTNQTICSSESSVNHKIILESGKFSNSEDNLFPNSCLNNFLNKINIDPNGVLFMQHKSFPGALKIPSSDNYNDFNKLREELASTYSNVEFTGASSGYCCVTLNDQIIQALKIFETAGGSL